MSSFKIQKIWQDSYEDYCHSGHFQSDEQKKASRAILACKSGRLGVNVSECTECGHMEFHKELLPQPQLPQLPGSPERGLGGSAQGGSDGRPLLPCGIYTPP